MSFLVLIDLRDNSQKINVIIQQPYHPVAQDWFPTEAKEGWAWSVPGWETSLDRLVNNIWEK